MIEFLKQRKIVIIICILVIILVGWKIYDSSNFETEEESPKKKELLLNLKPSNEKKD